MQIEIRLEGTTALICNKFTDSAAQAASSGTRTSSSAVDRGTAHEIAEAKLYIGINGDPMIPQPNLLRSLVDGGQFHKIGKSQVTTQKKSMLFSCVDIAEAEIKILHVQPWKVDTRAVRIPATGGRILAHRPMFDDWALEFIADVDTDLLNEKLFRAIVDDAGKRVGLGDFRPATKGPYGRYVVTSWKKV